MFKYVKLVLLSIMALTMGCGESETPKEVSTPVTETAPAKVETATEATPTTEEVATQLPAEVEDAVAAVGEKTEAIVEEVKEEVAAVAGDKPYQLVDGKISENALNGWRTYNGGGCGACHGKGAVGAVGPNLGQSVTTKLTKEDFVNIVTNGKPGTMMRPHKTNTRVMDNLDDLYAYLVARGDDVLGSGNLIKLPLGK